MLRTKGFNIVELMLVVAIIAIFSTVAIPTYKKYLNNSKVTSGRAYLDSYNGLISSYYSDNGVYPTNAQVGAPVGVPDSVAEYANPPYVAYVTIEPQSIIAGQCPYTINTAYISNYDGGDFYSNGNGKYVVFQNYIMDVKNTRVIKCYFYEYDPTTSSQTNAAYFRDCTNMDAINALINSCT